MLIVVHYCYRFLCTVVTDSCALLLLFSVHSIYHFLCTRRFCLHFLACALGECACRLGYKVKYYTVSRLLDELKLARIEGHELKFFEKIERLDLIIIDDFGMLRLEGQQQNDFEQIIDDRYHKKSLIISSQLPVADWYGVFSNEMLAEACLDRLVHKSLRFELRGDSMRKKY